MLAITRPDPTFENSSRSKTIIRCICASNMTVGAARVGFGPLNATGIIGPTSGKGLRNIGVTSDMSQKYPSFAGEWSDESREVLAGLRPHEVEFPLTGATCPREEI